MSFGVAGWSWGEQRPKAMTFYLDGTCSVYDQHGRAIKGFVQDSKQVLLATESPQADGRSRKHFANHRQVIAALAEERIDWRTLACAGWPQIPYAELRELKELPPTPVEELRKIRDPELRKDALKIRREADEARAREMAAATEE